MTKRPVEIEDIYRIKLVHDVAMSPDGTRVACVVTRPRRKENDYESRIYMVDLATQTVEQYTAGPRDTSPAWSPDGSRLALCSNRKGSSQLWVIPSSGGEARQVTALDGPVLSPVWSPDGASIAFVHRVSQEGDGEATGDDDGYRSDVMGYTRLQYKMNGEGFWDGKWKHIWVVDPDGGEPRQLTQGPYDHDNPAWSPDGTRLALVADRRPWADHDGKRDVYCVDVASGEIRQITDTDGPAASPSWSPDGTSIAYYGHTAEYSGATVTRIWVTGADGGGEPRCITGDFDRNVGASLGADPSWGAPQYQPTWTLDARALLTVAVDHGSSNVYRFDVESGDVSRVTSGQRALHGVSFSANRSLLAYVSTHPLAPGEVYVWNGDTGEERRVTAFNDDLLSSLELSAPERIEYQGALGWDVEGWVIKPVDFHPCEKYPLVLKIHGGPHGAFGYTFSHYHQLMAGKGYAVLYVNPRGSVGYGQDFVRATHHDWGGGDYQDIMAGVDHVVGLGFVDEKHMGVTGASFGGFMTDWTIGHTDRFCTAVAEVTTSNRYSQWGTSDYGFSNGRWEFQGYPWGSWENARQYLGRSPITYVQNINTPLLIIQGGDDHRCPLEQAEQLYTALKVLKKHVELVIFPGESHTFSRNGKPRHREERLQRVCAWFDRDLHADAEG